jgi:hypothetical protein
VNLYVNVVMCTILWRRKADLLDRIGDGLAENSRSLLAL